MKEKAKSCTWNVGEFGLKIKPLKQVKLVKIPHVHTLRLSKQQEKVRLAILSINDVGIFLQNTAFNKKITSSDFE